MPMKSRWQVDIPHTSLPSLLFTSPTLPLSTTTPALIDADNPSANFLTLNDYRLCSQRFAAGLRHSGLQDGDRLLLFGGNSLFFPVAFMGVIMAGGIFTGASPTYVAREVLHQLKDSEALYLLCAAGSLEIGLEAAAQVSFPKSRVFLFDDNIELHSSQELHGCRHWSVLFGSVSDGQSFCWDNISNAAESSKTAVLNYSSGTTGLPKGVEITHWNYVAHTLQVAQLFDLERDMPHFCVQNRWLCYLPMYHTYAQTVFLVTAPLRRIPVYIMPRFEFEKMLDCIQQFRITHLVLVPPVVVMMVKDKRVRRGDWDLSSVLRVVSGAAPLGREISSELENLWRGEGEPIRVNVTQGWGMTELTCAVLGWDPRQTSTTSSVGELLANCEAKIMNEDGTAEVPLGEHGEIWAKGPNVMKGYWRNEKATNEILTKDGWLMTGDIGYVDQHEKFFIVDRKKELIKVKGFQVAPAELEALLLKHPSVADAAVIGVNIDGEEFPRAYVVTSPGKPSNIEDIMAFVGKRVSKLKRLVGGVVFVDSIPRNPSGKIIRRTLREQARAYGEGKTSRL